MLRDIFQAYYYFYLFDFFYKIFPSSFFSKEQQLVFSSFQNNISYRLPESAKKDFFLPLRVLRRIQANSMKYVFFPQPTTQTAIYDTNTSSYEIRRKYLQLFNPNDEYHNLAKDNVINLSSGAFKFVLMVILVLIVPTTIIFSLFRRNKLKAGLKLFQFTEAATLLNYCDRQKIKKLYYFTIYEPDSNICSYLLRKRNIYTIFVTSEVPLRFGNMKMAANEIDFCFGYQLDEYEYYKQNILADKIKLLIPETVHETASYYIKKAGFETPKRTIGFVSSGMWLRKVLGDADSGFNELENEKKILEWLIDYVHKDKLAKLIIYLHPIEKSQKNFDLTQDHYRRLFGDVQPAFAPMDVRSSLSFNNSEICVALYSTLIYERIFMGFKSIITPLGIDNFPIENSSLDKCAAKTRDDLFKKLDSFFDMTQERFIESIGFQKRYYKNFEALC